MAESAIQGYTNYFKSQELSDLTIRVHYQDASRCDRLNEFPGHKVFLSAHSTWFKNACTGGFKEASENVINITGQNEDMVEFMLEFFYTGIYNTAKLEKLAAHDEASALMPIHVKVYVMADFYDAPRLRALAVQHFGEASGNSYASAIPDLEESIRTLYRGVGRTKTLMAHEITKAFSRERYYWKDWVNSEEFEAILKEFPDFVIDLVLEARKTKDLFFH